MIPGGERVRGNRRFPVQEGHALQLDVHVIQALGRRGGIRLSTDTREGFQGA